MPIETTADGLTFIAKTHALLARAGAALEQAPALGPKGLGNLVEHVEPIHDALARELPSIERAVAEFL